MSLILNSASAWDLWGNTTLMVFVCGICTSVNNITALLAKQKVLPHICPEFLCDTDAPRESSSINNDIIFDVFKFRLRNQANRAAVVSAVTCGRNI